MTTNAQLDTYLTERQIQGRLQERIAALSVDDSAALEQLVTALAPTASRFREIFQFADEVSRRDSLSLALVLRDSEILSQLEREGVGRKEKLKKVVQILQAKRFPELGLIRNELSKRSDILIKEFGLRVEFPEDLEGDTISFSLKSKSPADVAKLAEKLSAASTHPALEEAFSIMRGDYSPKDSEVL